MKNSLYIIFFIVIAGLITSCSGGKLSLPFKKDPSKITKAQPAKKVQKKIIKKKHAKHVKRKRWLDNIDKIDPNAGLSRDDYRDMFYKKNTSVDTKKKKDHSLNFSSFMITPERPVVADDKLVTLSVTEDVPLKEVLIELARRADLDMEIDPAITGSIIFRAKNRPFTEVIERVTRLAKLKYSFKDGILKVERDLPEIKSYRMNLLNTVRTSESSVKINTSLLGGGSSGGSGGSSGSSGGSSGGGGKGSLSGGSKSELTMSTDVGDIWGSIEAGVNNILLNGKSSTSSDTEESSPSGGSAIISANRQAGVISILATTAQHRIIKAFLDEVYQSFTSQVLIEAKVLEVNLNDQYRTGIDWSFLNSNVTGVSLRSKFTDLGVATEFADQVFTAGIVPAEFLGIGNTSIESTIQLVESFGTTRTLSSPRLNAMNNQHAVLTFAKNFVYFLLDVQEETQDSTGGGTATSTLTISSTVQTVPIGVLLTLQPSIDLEKNEIIMSIRPTLSRITGSVSDPGVAIIAAKNGITGLTSNVPIVEVRELDSILKIKSGDVMVVGGLMEERSTNTDRGVPGLSKIPLVGNLFKSVQKETDVVETVVFIKATIVPGSGVSVEDKAFYDKFAKDRHPLPL